ncbi:Uncharacterised protein [Mycobacteroides abscessus subsp. abscessus]|nr:Uncharacterised protein [Mycobacteroides abscessus subsp. abscessus]SKW58051.1 Uncharacterised protein [Mycobacteroides abscessus subsp. abscessus]
MWLCRSETCIMSGLVKIQRELSRANRRNSLELSPSYVHGCTRSKLSIPVINSRTERNWS